MVIWGHEHECRIRPEYNELQKFYVIQPGSSVITALCESELGPKQVGILKVHKKNFKIEEIPLRSVRQFVMGNVVLSDTNLNETDKHIEVKIEQILLKKLDKMVEECVKNRYCYDKQPTKPLVRIKVDYTNFETINEMRFAQKIMQKVANPKNVLQFYKLVFFGYFFFWILRKSFLNMYHPLQDLIPSSSVYLRLKSNIF